MGTTEFWVISHSIHAVVPNTADRSSAVQKVLSTTDDGAVGGGGERFPFTKDIYSLGQTNWFIKKNSNIN